MHPRHRGLAEAAVVRAGLAARLATATVGRAVQAARPERPGARVRLVGPVA